MRPQSIINVLNKVQHSRSNFEKYCRILQTTYEKQGFDEFFEEFTVILLNLFVIDTKIKNIFVQRSLEFMAKFAASFCKIDEDHVFYKRLIEDTMKYHEAKDVNVRLRACQFIKLLLCEVGDINLDDDLCDDLIIAMQERMNDIKPNVRLQAIIASQRLQNPNDKDDPIIDSYIKILSIESSAVLRKAVIESMAINMKSLAAVLQRCLDASDMVRLSVYIKLARVPVKLLKIEQRQYVLRNGFRSDAKIVQFIKKTMLEKWLAKYDKNMLHFCKALKLDASDEEYKQTIELLEIVLPALFSLTPINELNEILNLKDNKIPNFLTYESSLYWRCLIDYLSSNSVVNDCLELVMPDLMTLIECIENFCKKMQETKNNWEQLTENQILNQLLLIVMKYEMLDSTERLRTRDFITKVLTEENINFENTCILTKIFAKVEPNVDIRSQEVCMIISTINDPLITTEKIEPKPDDIRKRDLRIAPLRVQLNILREDMDTAILKQEFQQADQFKKEISLTEQQIDNIKKEFEAQAQTVVTKIPKNETATISKCMDILIAFLLYPKITEINPALRTNMDNFVKSSLLTISNLNSDFKPLKYYGLLCIIDKREALSAIQIFCQQLLLYHYHCSYNHQGIIISATLVTDLLLIYGSRLFGEEENIDFDSTKKGSKKSLYDTTRLDDSLPQQATNATVQDVVEIFSDMLDDSNPELREIGGSCLIKLLYHNVIKAASILSKLIIKWYNPTTEKDLKLRQMLGIFFSNYITRVPGSLTMIEKAFLPTLNIVINAPPTSPLVDIEMDSMIKFLVDISRPHQQTIDRGLEVHKNIALELCTEICNKPQSKNVHIYLRTLMYLDPPFDDDIILEDLKQLGHKIISLFNPQTQLKFRNIVKKYIDKLNRMDFDFVRPEVNQENDNNLSNDMSNLSVASGKRKRDSSNNSGRLESVNEDVSEEDELVIEQVDSEEEIETSEKEVVEPPQPRRSLRRVARL